MAKKVKVTKSNRFVCALCHGEKRFDNKKTTSECNKLLSQLGWRITYLDEIKDKGYGLTCPKCIQLGRG